MTTLLLALLAGTALAVEPARPTEPFRTEHAALVEELDAVADRVGKLSSLPANDLAGEMSAIVTFFRDELEVHAGWEERVLYPAVDRRVPTGGLEPFTASMRHDHTVVGRWIGELDTIARSSKPDPRAFSRRADNLLGLVRAHFEAEEDVLLPILDRTMTEEDYQREILAPSEGSLERGS